MEALPAANQSINYLLATSLCAQSFFKEREDGVTVIEGLIGCGQDAHSDNGVLCQLIITPEMFERLPAGDLGKEERVRFGWRSPLVPSAHTFRCIQGAVHAGESTPMPAWDIWCV